MTQTNAAPVYTKATRTKSKAPGAQPTPAVAQRAPAFRIETHKVRQRYLKLLIYGSPGVGKTSLAGSAVEVPSMRDVLMINAELGVLAIEDLDIDCIPLESYTITQTHPVSYTHLTLPTKA